MLWVYLDHYLTKLGIDSRFRAHFCTFRFHIIVTSIFLCLLIIFSSFFAFFYHQTPIFEADNFDKAFIRQIVLENQRKYNQDNMNWNSDLFNSKNISLNNSSNKNQFNNDSNISNKDKDHIIQNNKLNDLQIFRSNSDIESTMHEVESATWVIKDQLREQYPLNHCVNFINSKIKGIKINEMKDIFDYCKVIIIDYILNHYHQPTKRTRKIVSEFGVITKKPQFNGDNILNNKKIKTTTTASIKTVSKAKEETVKNASKFRISESDNVNVKDKNLFITKSPTKLLDHKKKDRNFDRSKISTKFPIFLISEYCDRICSKNSAKGGLICHCDSSPMFAELTL